MAKPSKKSLSKPTKPANSGTRPTVSWNIDILVKNPKFRVKKAQVTKLLKKILRELDTSPAEVYVHPALPVEVNELSVLFTNDQEIKKLNSLFRQKNKPTDVLSFSQQEGVHGGVVLGDLVISLDTAKKQAKSYGVTLNQELLRLIIHGLLHLYGYDHENVTKKRMAQMHDAEDTLMAKFGAFKGGLVLLKKT